MRDLSPDIFICPEPSMIIRSALCLDKLENEAVPEFCDFGVVPKLHYSGLKIPFVAASL